MVIGEISHSNSLWADVKVYQDHCYVSNETGGGVDVIDLSDVDNGNVSLVQRLTLGGLASVHNIVIDEVSGFLYPVGSNLNGGRLRAYDLSDPANPTFAGVDGTAGGVYCHDAQVVTYTQGVYAGREVAFCANPAAGLDIYDVTNKSAFVRLSRITYPGIDIPHQCWLSEDRSLLYFGDEGDETNQAFQTRTMVFDVQDIDNPVYLGEFSNGSSAIDHNLYVKGNLVFEANYSTGLRIFDRTDPVNATEVAYIDTFPEDDRTDFVGAWSVYPFFDSGTIIISDFNRGLMVVTLDLASLKLTKVGDTPQLVEPNAPLGTGVRISELTGVIDGATPALRVRTQGDVSFTSIPLTAQGLGLYDATLPGAPCGDTLEFYFEVSDTQGAVFTLPVDAPASLFETEAVELVADFTDDMESDTGWSGGIAGDTATTGQWVRVDPVGTGAQPEDDTTPDPGTLCWVTGQGAIDGGLGTQDVDGGFTTLMTPVLDLSALTRPRIIYDRWYSNTGGGAPGADIFVVDISNNDGATWTNVETVGPTGPGTNGGWLRHAFEVADVIAPTAQMRLRFIASDVGSGSIIEAGLDGFEVADAVCTDINTCTADFDNDGDVDLGDFGVFGAAFNSMTGDANYDAAADFDADGDVDLGDFGVFGSQFGRGDCLDG